MATRDVWYLTSGPKCILPSKRPRGFSSALSPSTTNQNKNQCRTEKHSAYDSCEKCNSSALHVPVQALRLGSETASDPEG